MRRYKRRTSKKYVYLLFGSEFSWISIVSKISSRLQPTFVYVPEGALACAVFMNNEKATDTLISLGANPFERYGSTSLTVIAISNPRIVRSLMRAGAPTIGLLQYDKTIQRVASWDNTMIQDVFNNIPVDTRIPKLDIILKAIAPYGRVLFAKLLIERGAKVTGDVLHIARMYNHQPLSNFLQCTRDKES